LPGAAAAVAAFISVRRLAGDPADNRVDHRLRVRDVGWHHLVRVMQITKLAQPRRWRTLNRHLSIFPDDSHDPIIYPVAATVNAKPGTLQYLAFLHSATTKAFFEGYGFSVLVKPTS
jgi:hypothetical protein